MITWSDTPEPPVELSPLVSTLAFTAGGLASWFLLCRPVWRRLIGAVPATDADCADSGFPARWWRHVAMRVAVEVPALPIVYATVVQG